jgi:hypothetical protein
MRKLIDPIQITEVGFGWASEKISMSQGTNL